MKHLLSIADLGPEGIDEVMRNADTFAEVNRRPIPKVQALRGKTVVSCFFEDSTRTRLSFETAARRLGADVMTFAAASSSLKKGESLRDTVATLKAIGADAFVVRHRSAGVPQQISQWSDASVVNAGDGQHEHPTQALLDCYTLRQHLGDLHGKHIIIVGDVKHSRVARSNVAAFTALGAKVKLVAPQTLMPPSLDDWPVDVTTNLDGALDDADAVYVLRIQQERMDQALLPSLREYSQCYGLDAERAARLKPGALILHPGPMNRGVEIAADVADSPNAVITEQVANGVSVRMAVLFLLLGSGSDVGGA
ncbi:MAG TPA: aspartate carbamoyltransferase catalytic subunit [Acidimicrobiales bacterium]|nr:aspartate carbamoyltransferase catalytic subunit [Acidimicrobiales bacterium]